MKKSSIKKTFFRGIQTLFFMLLGASAFLIALSLYDGNFNMYRYTKNIISAGTFNAYSFSFADDKAVGSIAEFCSTIEYSAQPDCVLSQVQPFYNYSEHNDNKLKSPDKFMTSGGVCRDIAVMYAVIFRKLGWDAYYEFPSPSHVFTRITRTWKCGVNMTDNCWIGCSMDGLEKQCEKYEP